MSDISKSHSLLAIISGLCAHFGKLYCYPSQEKLIELLNERVHIQKSRATLNRWLADLEGEGLIVRRSRHRRDPRRGWVFRSTLYEVTLRGYQILARFGVDVKRQISILRRMLQDALVGKVDRRSKVFGRHDPEQAGEFVREVASFLGLKA